MPLSRFNPSRYTELLHEKKVRIQNQFAPFEIPPIEVFESPAENFRMRAEFRVWQQDDHCFYAMFAPAEPKTPIRIDNFPIGSTAINRLMPVLLDAINSDAMLRKRLFQIEFLTTLCGEALVTLIYHRPLDEAWEAAAGKLAEKLNIRLIGRSKKQKLVLSDDAITERLVVDGGEYIYRQTEGSFTQPNAAVNQLMLEWVNTSSRHLGGDALELYCGNGNFTVILAQHFRRLLATEIAKTSVKSALWNFVRNGISNVAIARMSSQELTQALAGERAFRRLADITLSDYNFSTVLVDPPRAGLDDGTLQLIKQFPNILYISCNPDTLAANLSQLQSTHQIERFAIFDQFPYTDHIECGVHLSRH